MTINEMCGYRVVLTTAITKTVQARVHRKKRINKKWLKKYGYKEVPDNRKVYFMGDCVYMTSQAYKKIQKACGNKLGNPVEDPIQVKEDGACKVRYCKKPK